MSRLKKYLQNLTSPQSEIDSAKLRESTELLGASAAAACVVGEWVKIHGTIRALRLKPEGGISTVEAELWDGTGYITLLWLGRREIKGITTGRHLIADGRISRGPKQQPAIYNPRYQLLPNAE